MFFRTSYSSVLTIVSFSMERYLAICHPLYSHTMSGFTRAVRIIALVWLVSLLSAVPYALFTQLNYIDRPLNSGNYLKESAFCALLDNNIYPKVSNDVSTRNSTENCATTKVLSIETLHYNPYLRDSYFKTKYICKEQRLFADFVTLSNQQ